jgi:hypothetical protein
MRTEHTGAGEAEEGPLELDLKIERRQGLSGTVARKNERQATSFSGWLGLAEAIDVLRRKAGHPQAPPRQPGAAEGEPPA